MITFLRAPNYSKMNFKGNKGHKKIKRTFIDNIWWPYYLIAQIYYVIDTYFIPSYFGLSIPPCKIVMLCHHIVTLFGAVVLILPHVPWFILAPMAMHPFLIVFPH